MTLLKTDDIQGFVLSSYSGDLPCAIYLLLRIIDPESCRKWLGKLMDKITTGEDRKKDYSLNIAFSSTGLTKLGLNDKELSTFSLPFQEGMTAKHRTHILSDIEDSTPEN